MSSSLLPLVLGSRRDPSSKEQKAFPTLSKGMVEKILHRDGGSCRFCGFTSGMFQTVVPCAPFAGDEKSFAACCGFCERTLLLDQAGLSSVGVLIWLPEMSQAELNHLARALYVARAHGDPALSAVAGRAIEALQARKAEAKKRLGTDDPLLLATAFQESLTEAEYAQRGGKLEGIRLFPLDRQSVYQKGGEIDIFPRVMAYWISPEGPFGKTPVSEWRERFESLAGVKKD